MKRLSKNGVDISEDVFISIFSARVISILTDSYAFGIFNDGITRGNRDDAAGRSVVSGINPDKAIKQSLKKIIISEYDLDENQVAEIIKVLLRFTSSE